MKKKLSWTGNIEAQRQADEEFKKLRNKTKKKKPVKKRSHKFSGTYTEYLKSKQWENKKKQVFTMVKGRCEICGSKHKLQVHHLTYKNVFNEPLSDLQLLCMGCHQNEHEGKDNIVVDPMTAAFLKLKF